MTIRTNNAQRHRYIAEHLVATAASLARYRYRELERLLKAFHFDQRNWEFVLTVASVWFSVSTLKYSNFDPDLATELSATVSRNLNAWDLKAPGYFANLTGFHGRSIKNPETLKLFGDLPPDRTTLVILSFWILMSFGIRQPQSEAELELQFQLERHLVHFTWHDFGVTAFDLSPHRDAVSISEIARTDAVVPDAEAMITLAPFYGFLKRVDPADLNDLARRAMDMAFPGFRTLAAPTQGMQSGMKDFFQRGFNYVAWRRRPWRRYAGAENLPRGRYSTTVAQGPGGDDRGTLLRELLAYHDPRASGLVLLVDLATKQGTDVLAQVVGAIEPASSFAILFIGKPEAPSPFIEELSPEERNQFGIRDQRTERSVAAVEIPYQVTETRIDRVVDLRQMAVQEWFFETLGQRDTEYYLKPDRSGASTFLHLLPYLLHHDLGGNEFTNAVGIALRKIGAQGLVYPSARSDCGIHVEHGKLIGSYGWNMVDYRDAPFPRPEVDRIVDVVKGWPPDPRPGIAVRHIDHGYKAGTWHVIGIEKWHQAVLDAREQEYLTARR